MKKQDNTFMDSPLNYNFTVINAICDFFPYLITKIPLRVKRTEKNTSSTSSLLPFNFLPQFSGASLQFPHC